MAYDAAFAATHAGADFAAAHVGASFGAPLAPVAASPAAVAVDGSVGNAYRLAASREGAAARNSNNCNKELSKFQ